MTSRWAAVAVLIAAMMIGAALVISGHGDAQTLGYVIGPGFSTAASIAAYSKGHEASVAAKNNTLALGNVSRQLNGGLRKTLTGAIRVALELPTDMKLDDETLERLITEASPP
jgi:hypothetical protein